MKKFTLKERIVSKDVVLINAARANFWTFCMCINEDFFKKRPYLYEIAEIYQNIFDDFTMNIASNCVINMPPRAGKSFITSHFCAFWIANLKDKTVMRNCCTAELCKKLSISTRDIINNPIFRIIFPNTQIDYKSRSWKSWKIQGWSRGTSYFGAGVSGNIIGEGCALAITDDLYPSVDVALSNAQNEAVINWFNSSHNSRKEPFCAEINIGTRWTKRDCLGEIEKFGVKYIFKLPAIENEGTNDEKSYCEFAMPLSQLQRERDRLGGIDSVIWRAEYQQDPIEKYGILLPLDRLFFVDDEIPPAIFSVVIIDPANRGGDFFCAIETIVGTDLKFYVRRVLYNKNGIEQNCLRITKWFFDPKMPIDIIRCEANGIGLAATIMIKKLLPKSANFSGYVNNITKEIRIQMGYEFILNNFRFKKPNRDKEYEYYLFLSEIGQYSIIDRAFNPHDDGIDTLSSHAMFFKILLHSKKWEKIKNINCLNEIV